MGDEPASTHGEVHPSSNATWFKDTKVDYSFPILDNKGIHQHTQLLQWTLLDCRLMPAASLFSVSWRHSYGNKFWAAASFFININPSVIPKIPYRLIESASNITSLRKLILELMIKFLNLKVIIPKFQMNYTTLKESKKFEKKTITYYLIR